METKPFWESKILWVQVITVTLEALSLPELGAMVPPEARPWIAMASAMLTLVLRTITNTGVTLGVSPKDSS